MATINSDWKLVGVTSASRLDCGAVWPCIGMTERSINRGDRTFTYCGVGRRARLVAVAESSPVPGTGTIVGPDTDVLEVIDDTKGGATHLTLVHCTGKVKHFSDVFWGNISSQSALTAQGPDAQAAAVIDSVAFQFGAEVAMKNNASAVVSKYVANDSYRDTVPLYGDVDGENNVFMLSDLPADGMPITIKVDSIPVTFTRDGLYVHLSSSPLCGRTVTASYYPEVYAISYTAPCAVFFEKSSRCRTLHALYSVTDTSGCGQYAVICTFSLKNDRLLVDDVTHYRTVKNPVTALSVTGGEILVTGDTVYSIAEGEASVSAPSNDVSPRQATVYNDNVYILYGDSGVMVRKNGTWNTVLGDGELTTDVQMSLAVGAGGVISGGECGSVQIDDGGGWRLQSLEPCQLVREVAAGKNLLYALAADGRTLTTALYATDGEGRWVLRNVWPVVPADCNTLDVYEDWLVHAQIGGDTWRNANFGCNRAIRWGTTAESCNDGARLAVCHEDPNTTAVVSRPENGSPPYFDSMARDAGSEESFAVTKMVYTSLCGSAVYTIFVDGAEMGDGSPPPAVSVSENSVVITVSTTLSAGSLLAVRYTVHIMSSSGSPSPVGGILVVEFN